MRAVLQRCRRASVAVEGQRSAEVGPGLVVFLGVARGDTPDEARAMAEKIRSLRIFGDEEGRMNRSVADVGGEVLLVPQFTVMGDARRGTRPSFHEAAGRQEGERLWSYVGLLLEEAGLGVGLGVFGADMEVDVTNDGPVTILIDTAKVF